LHSGLTGGAISANGKVDLIVISPLSSPAFVACTTINGRSSW
jgi:hypothetical protein